MRTPCWPRGQLNPILLVPPARAHTTWHGCRVGSHAGSELLRPRRWSPGRGSRHSLPQSGFLVLPNLRSPAGCSLPSASTAARMHEPVERRLPTMITTLPAISGGRPTLAAGLLATEKFTIHATRATYRAGPGRCEDHRVPLAAAPQTHPRPLEYLERGGAHAASRQKTRKVTVAEEASQQAPPRHVPPAARRGHSGHHGPATVSSPRALGRLRARTGLPWRHPFLRASASRLTIRGMSLQAAAVQTLKYRNGRLEQIGAQLRRRTNKPDGWPGRAIRGLTVPPAKLGRSLGA